jgi:predicted RNA-binding protein YlxR (DUF448 family)
VPLRTCIVCQQKYPKRELIRIVRTQDGTVEVDLTGKRSGRGAYLCRDRECWDAALESGKVDRALKCEVSVEDMAALGAFAATLMTGEAIETDEVE